jgi:hypothetical protein
MKDQEQKNSAGRLADQTLVRIEKVWGEKKNNDFLREPS